MPLNNSINSLMNNVGDNNNNLNTLASQNFKNELKKIGLGMNSNINVPNLYIVKKHKPKCNIKKSVTLIKKPNHKGRIMTLRRVCTS
jgi:hypothetical protein